MLCVLIKTNLAAESYRFIASSSSTSAAVFTGSTFAFFTSISSIAPSAFLLPSSTVTLSAAFALLLIVMALDAGPQFGNGLTW